VKFLTITDDKRNILYVGEIHEGKKHDFKILEEEFLDIDMFEHTVWVDLGFIGIKKRLPEGKSEDKIKIPHKASKNTSLTKEQKEENTQKASKRVVVEHCLGSVKSFSILKNRHRTLNLDNISSTVRICCGLSNFKNQMRLATKQERSKNLENAA